MVIVTNRADIEFGLTLAAVPVTILILVSAAFFVRRESSVGMIIIIVCFYGGPIAISFLTIILAPILRRHGLLPLQTSPHVRPDNLPRVPARPAVSDLLRHHYLGLDRLDHRQRLHVHAQFPQGLEATHQPEEGRQRGRKDHRAVQRRWRTGACSDDDRLSEPFCC